MSTQKSQPPKQFFSQLAQTLCSMKDTPFSRIGEFKPSSSLPHTLSFQPERLFDQQKMKQNEKYVDESYIKFQQEQNQQIMRIDYDLLKKNTNQEYGKEVQMLNNMRKVDYKQKFSWFGGGERGACRLCGKCVEYQGCFSVGQAFGISELGDNVYETGQFGSKVQLMQCYKCKCPMNSHALIPQTSSMRQKIYNTLIQKSIQDTHLQSQHILLSFKIPQQNLPYLPHLLHLLQLLNCPPLSYKLFSKLNYQLALIKTNILENGNTQKTYIQSLFNLIECIKMEKEWRWRDDGRDGRDGRKVVVHQMYEELYDIVKKVGVKVEREVGVGERDVVVVVLARYEMENVRKLNRYLSGNTRAPIQQNNQNRSTLSNSTSASSNFRYNQQPQQTDMSILSQKYNIQLIHLTNSHKQFILLSQFLFKQNYELNYSIFILPAGSLPASSEGRFGNANGGINSYKDKTKKVWQYNSQRMKDILDYNGYLVFLQNLKNVDRVGFQHVMSKVMGYRTSKIEYIIGQQLLNKSIQNLSLSLCAKPGPQTLTLPFASPPQHIHITNTSPTRTQISHILNLLHPQFNYSQRCILIIRPFLIHSNYEEIIVNLLRINKFVLLKRVQIKISQDQARYLGVVEGVEEAGMEEYVRFMTAGVCQIVLVSKRAAIYDAYALANGCLTGPTSLTPTTLKHLNSQHSPNTISIQTRRNHQVYEQCLPLYSHQYESKGINQPNPSHQVFKSVRQLINIQKVLFGCQFQQQYAINIKTREIVGVKGDYGQGGGQAGQAVKFGNLRGNQELGSGLSHKVKQAMMKELRNEHFNYWIFTSKSQTITQQLCGIFLPECTLFEPITVLLKPGLTHLAPSIRRCLLQHRYHIIAEKQLQMTRPVASEFIFNCQKIRLPNETIKYLIDAYSKQKVYIFCLSKIAGRRQIMSMLSGYTFLTNIPIQMRSGFGEERQRTGAADVLLDQEFIRDQILCDFLVPIWNNQELLLRTIAQPLANLEQSIHTICQHLQPDPKNPRTHPLSKIQQFQTLNYIIGSFLGVALEDLNMSTKLGKLSIYLTQIPQIPRLQSWYYSQISKIKPNYIPLLFQYRQIGQTMVCVQSDKGVDFMNKVQSMYKEEMEKMNLKMKNSQNFQLRPVKKDKRRSLVLFLWGKKLAEMCLDLCAVKSQMADFGEIVYKNGDFRGIQSLDQAQASQHAFLNRLYHDLQNHKQIKTNIKKLMDSRHQKQRFTDTQKRLLPSFALSPISASLRIIEKTDASKLSLMDKFTFIDPQNQASKLKDLYSLHLFNILPEIRTKYSMIAQIYYFFVKAQFQYAEAEMIGEIEKIFTDLLTDVEDLEVLEYEIYLRFLIEYVKMEQQDQFRNNLFQILKSYPNLRKNKKIQRDDIAGKKRKLLSHNKYFKRKDQQPQQVREVFQKKYMDFDLNTLKQQPKPSVLYDPSDPLHYRLAHIQNRVNLLREPKQDQHREGVYVEFEKNISEKQELLKQKIRRQAERFNYQKEDEILYGAGLEKQLWYRRTKGQKVETVESKTNNAIQKQIEKLLSFKQQQKQRQKQKKDREQKDVTG